MNCSRVFAHSFPRRHKTSHAKGIEVLECILEHGILLAPEIVAIPPEQRVDQKKRPTLKSIQRRFCLTYISLDELCTHSKHFGEFSILFEFDAVLALGALPVYYFTDSEHIANLPNVSIALLHKLAEIQKLLLELDRNRSALSIDSFLQAFEEEYDDISRLSSSIEFLASNFYYAGQVSKTNGVLRYYQQYEWRILAGIEHLGHRIDSSLTEEHKKHLAKIDEIFFSKTYLKSRNRSYSPYSEECRVIKGVDGKSIAELISGIVAPPEAISEVVRIAKKFSVADKVVSLYV